MRRGEGRERHRLEQPLIAAASHRKRTEDERDGRRIASAIGFPLLADECTTKQTRISYARMLIEVNVTKPIPQQITVMDPNCNDPLGDSNCWVFVWIVGSLWSAWRSVKIDVL
ncbi:hypothetical protein MTR67_023170, partial [Solanum verrucosum]